MPHATPSPLLLLPPEIRLNIYRHLLLTPPHLLLAIASHAIHVHPFAHRLSHGNLHLSILRVCRKVYDEALPVLYGENTFLCLQVGFSVPMFWGLPRGGEGLVGLVRRLRVEDRSKQPWSLAGAASKEERRRLKGEITPALPPGLRVDWLEYCCDNYQYETEYGIRSRLYRFLVEREREMERFAGVLRACGMSQAEGGGTVRVVNKEGEGCVRDWEDEWWRRDWLACNTVMREGAVRLVGEILPRARLELELD